jgi:hypothetical protein|tara:strand:- start:502 stop:675 length:174 start_codon:yes stop_codon:yes gene_type:complete
MEVMSFAKCHDDAILWSLIKYVCDMKNLRLPVLVVLIYKFAAAEWLVPERKLRRYHT